MHRDTWRNRLREPVETALVPLRAVWSVANNHGWLGQPLIGNQPHLGPAALAKWREILSTSRIYLEYGSGGSTVEAVQSVDLVVSVETDQRFLTFVQRKANSVGAFHPIHVDVGWISKWGRPLVTWRSETRLRRWREYPQAPWALFDRLGVHPDFIFVDGRFRVACVLESFMRLPDHVDCRFMMDDFQGRGNMYGPVLEFAETVESQDRAISFYRCRHFDREKCGVILERHYSDHR